MAAESRIVQLSKSIATNTEIFDEWLKQNEARQPSFEADGPLLDGFFPPEIATAKLAVEDATLELRELLLGPRRLIHEVVLHLSMASETILRAGIPHKVPLDNPSGISYAELSQQTGISEIALQKVLRNAIAHRVFTEPSQGMLAHSAASRLWATDPLMDDWASYFLEDGVMTFKYLWQALHKYPDANEPTQSAVSLKEVDNKGGELDTFYNMLAMDPERARRFAAVMSTYQKGDGHALRHVVDGYDWASLPDGSVVVDIGGSHGHVSTAVATKFKHLNFVVQDLQNTIASAPEIPAGLPVKLMAHDFFEPQPVKGAKVYLFRWIFHNWSDKYCLNILQSLIPALENGSRILIMDVVVPPQGAIPNTVERDVRWMDLAMLALFNAGDRPAEQWESLFKRADARFKYNGVKLITGSTLSFVEAEWCS